MENPIQTQENLSNNPESKEKALELIQSMVEEYDEETRQIINTYLDTSKRGSWSNKMQYDKDQRVVLIPLVNKINLIFQQLKDLLEINEYKDNEPDYIASLRSLYSMVFNVRKLLQETPDERYSERNLETMYGGKEFVPAGTMTYEHTREAVQGLKSTIEGIKIGLGLIK